MRTTVIVPISYTINEANSRLKNYFATNGYTAEQNGAEVLMRGGSALAAGNWYILPQVMQGQVVLQGFVGRPGTAEITLEEDGIRDVFVKIPARSAMGELQQILSYPAPGSANQNMPQAPQYQNNPAVTPAPAAQQVPQYQYNPAVAPAPMAQQPYQHYAQVPGNIGEKNASLAIWSLVIGVLACVLPFIGVMVGGLGVLIGLWMGFSALKTSKRTLAIFGIVLNFIGVAIVVLVLALEIGSIL